MKYLCMQFFLYFPPQMVLQIHIAKNYLADLGMIDKKVKV